LKPSILHRFHLVPPQNRGTNSAHKLQEQSTTSEEKARSALAIVEPFVNDLDGPRKEDGKEVAEKVDSVEQGIECLRVGLEQGPYHVKIYRFSTLLSQEHVQHAMFHGQAGLRSIQDGIDPIQRRSGSTHASSSEGEEEEEGEFDRVVEGEINYKRVYRAFIRRDAALPRERNGYGQDLLGKHSTREKIYPDSPNGYDALHVTLALGNRVEAGLATIACGGGGDLEDLVSVVDVQE